MPSTAKSCANYANSFLAKKKAINEGYDEATLLNQKGTIAEGPGENIFIINNSTIKTPPISDDVLQGITRDTAITLAKDIGLEVREESISIEELMNADECFFTGTAAEITPIRKINNKNIGNGAKGIITDKIQNLYFETVKGKQVNTTIGLHIARRHKMLKIGDSIPQFEVQDSKGNIINNQSIEGKKVIFYFYPKKMTPLVVPKKDKISQET